MNIFPAIDLFEGQAVRLLRGDYNNMTVYSKEPLKKALEFKSCGAKYLHVVDLEGAKDGETKNFETVKKLISDSGLLVEIGGGIRSEDVIKKYLDIGAFRVILGTAAVTDTRFLREMCEKYGDRIAVGVDIKDGKVAIKGWTEVSEKTCFEFFSELENYGVKTVICTDISKDGVLGGTNLELYKELGKRFSIDIIASGGVSSLSDVSALNSMGIYGAILGKALYTGSLDLKKAIEISE